MFYIIATNYSYFSKDICVKKLVKRVKYTAAFNYFSKPHDCLTRKWFDYLCFKISFNLNFRRRCVLPLLLTMISYYYFSSQFTSQIIINQMSSAK